jgi:hypothetical protein
MLCRDSTLLIRLNIVPTQGRKRHVRLEHPENSAVAVISELLVLSKIRCNSEREDSFGHYPRLDFVFKHVSEIVSMFHRRKKLLFR